MYHSLPTSHSSSNTSLSYLNSWNYYAFPCPPIVPLLFSLHLATNQFLASRSCAIKRKPPQPTQSRNLHSTKWNMRHDNNKQATHKLRILSTSSDLHWTTWKKPSLSAFLNMVTDNISITISSTKHSTEKGTSHSTRRGTIAWDPLYSLFIV